MLNSPAHPCRYRRFACPLTGANARLAEKRGSVTPSFRGTCTPYLLPVRLAHQIEAAEGFLVALCEPDYPPALAALEDAPPVLGCLGHAHLLRRPTVAIVGARNASANGRRLARQLAAELGEAKLLVASGLARGIDAAAHEGALETGTAAVVAGGVDVIYPEENTGLYEEIRSRGVIISEIAAGTVPQARHFPRRNRLISGMARGVLVIEAALRSGSLITARFAADQGRDVFAVPGSPLDPRARGCNNLIRQGAVLVESAADVLDVLEGARPPSKSRKGPRPHAAGCGRDRRGAGPDRRIARSGTGRG